MLFRKLSLAVAAVIMAITTGCASFPQNEISKVNSLPDVSQYKNKPSVFVDLNFYRGEPGNGKSAESSAARDAIMPIVEKTIKDSKLFGEVTYDEFDQKNVEYTLKVNVYNHGNEGSAAVSGFLTGFTLGVIPGAATDNYTLTIEAADRNGTLLESISNKDSVTTWIGLWFIPAMGNTPGDAIGTTLDNQIKAALKVLIESGKLKYSLQQYYRSVSNA